MKAKKQIVLERLRKRYPERVNFFKTRNIEEQIERYKINVYGKEAHEEYGKNLRKVRKSLGLSLDEVGRIIGITGEAVRKYELAKNRTSDNQQIDLVYVEIFALIYDKAPVELLPGDIIDPLISYLEVKDRADLITMELGCARYGAQIRDRLRHVFLRIIKAKQDEKEKYYNFFSALIRTPLYKEIMDIRNTEMAAQYLRGKALTKEDAMEQILVQRKDEIKRYKIHWEQNKCPLRSPDQQKEEKTRLDIMTLEEKKKGTAGRFEMHCNLFEDFGKEESGMLAIMAHVVVSDKESWIAFCNFVEGGKYFCGEKYDSYKP